MQSTSFRLVSAAVTLLLLVGLIGVVIFVLNTQPYIPARIQTRLTPRALPTPSAPVVNRTSLNTSAAQQVQQRIDAAGFAFTPPAAYELDRSTTAATLTSKTGAVFLLRGGPPEQLSTSQTSDLDMLFDEFVAFYATRDKFQSRNKQPTAVAGVDGRAIDLVSAATDNGFSGRIVMAQPALGQLFLLVGISPAPVWERTGKDDFDQLLTSITFFPLLVQPTAVTPITLPTHAVPTHAVPTHVATAAVLRPTLTPTTPSSARLRSLSTPVVTPTPLPLPSNWRVYSDGNVVNDLMVVDTTIWAATEGGVSTWNRNNNEYIKFTTIDGLTVNRTTAVVHCPLPGFGLVFGSTQGLQIFDPARSAWKTVNSANSEMHFDDVATLYCSPEYGFLLVGYAQHGLDLYDVKQGWVLIDQRRGLQQNEVKAVTVIWDREQIWVASAVGISVLTEKGVILYDQSNTPLETLPVTVMVSDSQGRVWLGAGNKVYRIDDTAWTIYSDSYVLASAFPTGLISALALAGDDALWIGSDQGELCLFDPTAVTCQRFFTPTELTSTSGVTALTLDGRGRLYVATTSEGVRLYDNNQWRIYRTPDEPLLGNRVYTWAEDATGLFWVATDRGLYQIDPVAEQVIQQFTRENTAYSMESIVTLLPLPNGRLWVGGKGVGYFDGVQWVSYTKANGLADDRVQAIATDEQLRVWFGTRSGLSIWNGESFFTLTRADRLPSDNILTLQADGAAMWIGSDAGLLRFAGNQFQIYTTVTTALAGNRIAALAKAADGALLIGTDQGLSRLVANKMSIINELQGYAISAIGLSKNDTLWVGTYGQGLFYYDGNTWGAPPYAVNPPDPTIQAILVDRKDAIWIAGWEGGVLRYIP